MRGKSVSGGAEEAAQKPDSLSLPMRREAAVSPFLFLSLSLSARPPQLPLHFGIQATKRGNLRVRECEW